MPKTSTVLYARKTCLKGPISACFDLIDGLRNIWWFHHKTFTFYYGSNIELNIMSQGFRCPKANPICTLCRNTAMVLDWPTQYRYYLNIWHLITPENSVPLLKTHSTEDIYTPSPNIWHWVWWHSAPEHPSLLAMWVLCVKLNICVSNVFTLKYSFTKQALGLLCKLYQLIYLSSEGLSVSKYTSWH